MRPRTSKRLLRPRLAAVILLVAGLLVTTIAASAASLGGIRHGDLFATAMTTEIPVSPPYVAYDSFTGCHNVLDGWVDSLGNVWTSHEGDWQCLGDAVARNQKRYSIGHASLDLTLPSQFSLTTFISRVSTQHGRSGPGLALFSDGEFFISVVYKRDEDRLVIGAKVPSGFRELASVEGLPDYNQLTLTVSVDGTTLSVLLEGVQVTSLDLADPTVLTSDEQIALFSNTRVGLAADNDNWSRFDTFGVLPWP